MRQIPAELADRIESGAATLCHAWLLKRVDDVVAGFTDHDRDIEVGGVHCRAESGWTAGAAEGGVGLTAGSAVIAGVLDDEAISESDIAMGLLDDAEIALWRVDWRRPDLGVRLWVARLVRIRRDGEGFTAELEGPLAALDRVVGRTYGRDCDAQLGDSRCTVDLANFPGAQCDKRWATCRTTFGNGLNFQGFPDTPGDDFLAAVPAQGRRNDGRSRR
jgi:hypothetical protein